MVSVRCLVFLVGALVCYSSLVEGKESEKPAEKTKVETTEAKKEGTASKIKEEKKVEKEGEKKVEKEGEKKVEKEEEKAAEKKVGEKEEKTVERKEGKEENKEQVEPGKGPSLARGWGDSIAWRTLEEAKGIAAKQRKPIMVLIHKSWCGACAALKPLFAASKDIADASEKLVMVNTEDDEEPMDPAFAPDGGYIPRIVFMSPDGVVLPQYVNPEGHDEYKYFHSEPESIVATMNQIVKDTAKPIVKEDL